MVKALIPPMGWNSWNQYGRFVTEKNICKAADDMARLGFRDAGYRYVVLDDHWHGGRGEDGKLFPHKERFPSGIRALADHVHSLGMLFGIYSDAAGLTCGGEPGSYGHEKTDADTFADWGVDFLKYDFCHVPRDISEARKRYRTMSDALQATGRDMLFSMSEWGVCKGYEWGADIGASMWRTTLDLTDYWENPTEHTNRGNSIRTIFGLQMELASYQFPGGFNDPDMLVVGLGGKGYLGEAMKVRPLKPGCTAVEYRSHMSMWCMLGAPLFFGAAPGDLNGYDLETLLDPGIISIDQDPLCKPCRLHSVTDGIEIYVKDMADSEIAVMILNTGSQPVCFAPDFDDISGKRDLTVLDIWNKNAVYEVSGMITLDTHEAKVYRIKQKP